MADVYVNALTTISTEPTTTDSLVAVNRSTNEGKIIDYNKLADAILNKIASKQYSGLNTTSKLLVGAINELDSDVSSLNSSLSSYTEINLASGVTMYLNKQIRFGAVIVNTGSNSFSETNIVDKNGASIIPKANFNSMCQYYSGNSSQGNVVGKLRATSNGKLLLTELTDVQVTKTYVYGSIWFVY